MDQKGGAGLFLNFMNELPGERSVERHYDGTANDAGPERDDPLGCILTPEEKQIALSNSLFFQLTGEPANLSVKLAVAESPCAVAVVVAERFAIAQLRETLQQLQERSQLLYSFPAT